MTSALPALLVDPVNGPDARDAARRELEKAQYHRDDPSLIDHILSWFGRQVGRLFSGGTGGNATLLLLLLLLAAVIFAVVRAGPPRRRRRMSADADDPLRPLAAADHRRLAMQFQAAGERAQALREWLRAAIQTIEERGVLPVQPGRTGAATARAAGPLLPGAAADLQAAVRAFDEVWFGGRAATEADVAVARSAADGVRTTRVDRRTVPAGYAVPS